MVALGEGAVSYARGTPVDPSPGTLNPPPTIAVVLEGAHLDPGPFNLNPEFHIKTLIIHKLSSRNFTTQNDLHW